MRLVVKVGGAVAAASADAILELASEHEVVVVHGAGPQITAEMQRAGIHVEFVRGMRRTPHAALPIVKASFGGVGEALCEALGGDAVQLFGDEVGLLAVPNPMLGWVGDPVPCAPRAIESTLAAGLIPVVAPLAVGPLNVNADDAAAALALGLGADRLLFLTDVDGLILDGDVVDTIDVGAADALLADDLLEGGIIPKLRAAAAAARAGVPATIGRTAVAA